MDKWIGSSSVPVRSAVRFSFGAGNTAKDVDYILKVLPKLIERLRSFASF